ncbi:DUF389 domain-containing protein [Actinoplanes sp. NPDC024001]|uniref:DUF389 domain-containing protein n=1 Tax=Actinoplanes sp. NPDC024001 TaxID=3154598 RepID=UPI0033D25B45
MVGASASVTESDLDRMVGRLFLDTPRQRSAFWVLLVLAAVIATAGVVADSDATVIGAMIVAPLMTPILGTAYGLVLADRRHVVASTLLVVAGAALVVGIGYLVGLLVPGPIVADTNSQVASRVDPELIDLVSALATGAVGAFALVRSDVSDTLPGVAIAISLVPPLAVVGLTLESGAPGQAAGAFLLFATNVAAIVATSTGVLLGYRVRAAAVAVGRPVGQLRARTVIVVGVAVVLVAVPLTIGSVQAFRAQAAVSAARPVTESWAQAQAWSVVDVSVQQGILQVVAAGPPPAADSTTLRQELDQAGVTMPVRLSLILGGTRDLPQVQPG